MKIAQKILILNLFFLLACKKDSNSIPPENHSVPATISNNGELSVYINGVKWSQVVYTKNKNRFSFTAIKYKTVGGVSVASESLTFNLIQKTLSKQTLYAVDSLLNINPSIAKTCSSFNTLEDDGDVACDNFEVIAQDSVNNYIQITNANTDYSEISGVFNSNYHRTSSCHATSYPDTIILTNGKFHIYLK
jgi:hypothetical protein